MKKSLIYSGIIHLALIVGIFLFSPASTRLEGYPTIYRVGLVSLPSGGKGGGKTAEGTATMTITKSKPDEKGVAVKEFNKTPVKKKTKKSTEKAKVLASSQKKEGKVTQKDDLGAEYGLGNGISAATLDGGGFGSSYYLALVFGKIRDAWENPVETSSTLRVTIYFKLLKDGQVLDAQVEKSSGIDLFDQSALRSVLSDAPFPPLPVEYTGEYLGIHLEFEYFQ
ncbi:MAG: energy transducer TonB [Candidatus Zixiibacteriota bacterium]